MDRINSQTVIYVLVPKGYSVLTYLETRIVERDRVEIRRFALAF